MTLQEQFSEKESYEIAAASDYAQEQLIAYAKEQGYDVEITVEEGEVYLNGESSEWFEENAQTMFDDFFSSEIYS